MAILPIRIYPDPVLRVLCPRVESFDRELGRLAADMIETMHAAPGVGLAAPQVGVELRLAVVDVSVGKDRSALKVLINPEVVEERGRLVDTEGCLSIPGINEKLPRPASVKVVSHDLQGEVVEIESEQFEARAVCHEIDHLDGVLFIDYLTGLRRDRVRRQLKKQQKERRRQG